MADINTALEASKEAIERLIVKGERCGPAWNAPRAPGKWSPSQIVEHIARSLEESTNMAAGRPTKFPSCRSWFTRSSAGFCSSGCCGRVRSRRRGRTKR